MRAIYWNHLEDMNPIIHGEQNDKKNVTLKMNFTLVLKQVGDRCLLIAAGIMWNNFKYNERKKTPP